MLMLILLVLLLYSFIVGWLFRLSNRKICTIFICTDTSHRIFRCNSLTARQKISCYSLLFVRSLSFPFCCAHFCVFAVRMSDDAAIASLLFSMHSLNSKFHLRVCLWGVSTVYCLCIFACLSTIWACMCVFVCVRVLVNRDRKIE